MVDLVDISRVSGTAPASRDRGLPRQQLEEANAFIKTVRALSKTGDTPEAEQVRHGWELLKDLEDKAEVYLFSSAVLAGQEAASDADLEQRLGEIGKSLERATGIADRLRQTLKGLSN